MIKIYLGYILPPKTLRMLPESSIVDSLRTTNENLWCNIMSTLEQISDWYHDVCYPVDRDNREIIERDKSTLHQFQLHLKDLVKQI